ELEHCAEHGIAFVPWSPLGGTGGGAAAVGERFPQIQRIAEAHAVSPQQVVLAWELALGEHVIPIPGASRPESITDSAQAMALEPSVVNRTLLTQITACPAPAPLPAAPGPAAPAPREVRAIPLADLHAMA